jgi:hypothetical protein
MSELHRARALRAVLAVSLLCAAPIARAACSGLASAVSYAAGTSVRQVVRADFNRDGVDDLATANGTGSTLSVLLGNAAGGFAAPVSYASGTTAIGLATGDFDGDGVTDLAVAVSTGVSIWRGTGTGTFTGGGIVACGSGVRGVVCGDFDRDGDDDVAAASSSTNNVIVLTGDGAGAFTVGATLAAGTAPTRVVAADFDDDGKLDLACSNNSSANVSVFRGDGAGGFASAATLAAPGSPWGLVTLDANADGNTDLLVSNGASTTLTLLRGTGTGAFTNAGAFTTALAPRDLAVADFDGDGIADVAAACAAANQVSVLRGTGGAFAAYATYAAGAGATSACAGDFNRDGIADLACANTSANNVTRWLGTCPSAIAPVVTMLAPNGGEAWWPGTEQTVRWTKSASVTSVDVELSRDDGATWTPLARGVTGDHVKVAASGSTSERMRLRVRDAAIVSRGDASDASFAVCGLFRTPRPTALPFAAAQLERADLDGDGQDDAIAASATQAVVLRGIGDGRFTVGTPFAVDANKRVRLGDVNADGLLDLVTLGATQLAWRAGDGAGNFGPPQGTLLADGADFVCADFDADGFADVAALVDGAAGPRLVVRTTQELPLAREWSAPLDATPRQLVTGDLDGDGIADLAIAEGEELEVWRGGGAAGRGDATFALASSRALPGGAGDLSLGDFDRDGRIDVAACALGSGDLWTLGTTTLAAAAMELGTPVAAPTGATARSPVVADFDGDGRADVALVAPASFEVRVLSGTAGGFGAPRAFAGGAGALLAGDFARDGATDLLVARPDSADVICLVAMCPPLAAAEVRLAERHAGERWSTGFARTVRWSRSAAVALARVELSRDGGAHWTAISGPVLDSTYTWIVTGPATANARLRVCDAASSTRVDVSAEFAIREPFDSEVRDASPMLANATKLALGARGVAIVAQGRALVGTLRADGGAEAFADAGDDNVRDARLADVDGDGRDDLVTMLLNYVSVRLAQLDGGFGDARLLGTAGANAALVVADRDGDGLADVAVACGVAPAQRVLAWRSLGAGADGRAAFGAASQVALPSPATACVLADVNADGIADLLVAHATGLATLLGNGTAGRGDGTLRLSTTRTFGAGSACALACADLNGDGRLDVVAADSTNGAVLLGLGDALGAFATPSGIAGVSGARALAWGDFDDDGTPDLCVTGRDGVKLVRGDGVAFAPAGVANPGTRAIAVRDGDGDGRAEVWALDPSGAVVRTRSSLAAPATVPALESPAPLHPALGAALTLHWNGLFAADVELSYDGGTRWTTLARAVQGGTWRWNVNGPVTGLALLRVRDAFAPSRGDTTAAFVIAPVSLDAATGGDAMAFAMAAPWPNPSRGATTFAFTLPSTGAVSLEILDVSGRRVRTLRHGALAAGRHAFAFDGRSESGSPLPPGSYFARVRTSGGALTRAFVLAR